MNSVVSSAIASSSIPASAPASSASPSNPAPGDGATPFDALLQDAGPDASSAGAGTPAAPAGCTPSSMSSAQASQPSTAQPQTSGKASDPNGTGADAAAQGDAAPVGQDDSTTIADSDGSTSADQPSAATAAPTSGGDDDVADAVSALLKALQRAGFSSADGTGVDAAATGGTDDGSPLSDLLGKLAKALGALEKDEKKGTPPSKDDLKQLQDAVAALSGYLATLQAGAASPTGSTTATAQVSDGSTAALSGVSGLLGGPAGAADDTTQGGAAAGNGTADGAATGSGDASLGQLADKIEALSSALAPTQPGLAGDLDRLAKTLQPGAHSAATAAQASHAGTTAPGLEAPATGKNGAAGPASVNAPIVQSADAPGASGVSVKGSHSAKPDPDKPADHRAEASSSPAGVDKTIGPDKTDAASATVDPAGSPASVSPAGTDSTQVGAQATVALAPPQVPAGGGTAIAQQAQAAYQPVDTAAINLPQMAFEIARHADRGSNEFQIRLDPADLGRVDVKLAVDPTGAISAHLSAERPETLDLLRRDAGALNQALTQAGLDGSKTNLQFSLSQNPFTRQDGNSQPTPQTGEAGESATAAPAPLAPAISLYRGRMTSSGLNIFV